MKIYVDGEFEGPGSVRTTNAKSNDAPLLIGQTFENDPDYSPLNGSLNEVRIWNVARTEEQIRRDMNQHLQGNESGLIAYYRLDEAGGRVVRDSTARGHDGVLSHFDAVLPITGLFNTGVDDDGVLLFQRQADPHYTVALSAGTADSGTVIDADGFPIPPWIANDDNSRWIGLFSRDFDNNSEGPSGDYIYRTTFELPNNVDVNSVVITGRWASDNTGVDILINDSSVGSGQLSGASDAWTSFRIDSGFLAGTNTLEFVLNNSAAGPTGLRVDDMIGSFSLLQNLLWTSDIPAPLKLEDNAMYDLRITVYDDDGGSDTSKSVLTVNNVAPTTAGTIGDATNRTTSLARSALQFDGLDSVLTPLNIDQSATGGTTFDVWVYPTGTSMDAQPIISTSSEFVDPSDVRRPSFDWSLLRQGNNWHLFNGVASIDTGVAVERDVWQHLAVAFDPAAGVSFYKNGLLEFFTPQIGFRDTDQDVTFGSHRAGNAGKYFEGKLDEIRIWDRPLTANEIVNARRGQVAADHPNLIGYWPLDDGLGEVAIDRSTGGHDATLGAAGSSLAEFKPVWTSETLPTFVTLGGHVMLDGSLSTDPGVLDTLSYAWEFHSNNGQILRLRPTRGPSSLRCTLASTT